MALSIGYPKVQARIQYSLMNLMMYTFSFLIAWEFCPPRHIVAVEE